MKNTRSTGRTARTALASTALALIAAQLITRPAAHGQLSIGDISLSYTIDFDTTVAGVNEDAFLGTGFEPIPVAGRLDSDAWAVTGWSNGNLAFGGTQTTSNTDYTRGSATNPAVTAGGMYSFSGGNITTGRALGFQPGGSDWAPGTLTLRIQNNDTETVTGFSLSYIVYVRNDQLRGNSFNLSHSGDDTTYTPEASLNLTSTQGPDVPAQGFVANTRSITLNGLSIAAGGFFYLRWSGADVNGSGSRDEFALDSIQIGTFTTGGVVKNLTWSPVTDNWNTTEPNWFDGVGSATFADYDVTNFTDSGLVNGGAVVVDAGGVAAGAIIVSHTSGTYTFQGGPINGSAPFNKTNDGTLVFTAENGLTGAVSITGGTVVIGNGNHLGSGANDVLLDNTATLRASAPLTSAHPLTVGATGGTVDLNGNAITQTALVAINGPLSVSGGADLGISGSAIFGTTGSLSIAAGSSVTLSQGSGVVTMRSGGVFNGDLNVSSTARLNLNGSGLTYGGTGKINILGNAIGAGSASAPIVAGAFASFNALITNSLNVSGGTVTSDIVLNPAGTGHVAFTPGDITTATYTTASFLAFIGSNNFGLDIDGKITGEGDVFISGNSAIGGGGGILSLRAKSTYSGNTLIDSAGTILLGVDDALPAGTNVIFGNLTGVGSPVLDLNGFSQEIASLSHGGVGTPGNFTITNNSSATDSTLTIGGAVTPANPFGGRIADGAFGFKLKVLKRGSNTTTLNGVAEFSTLEVVGGTLNLDVALNTTAGSVIDVTPSAGTANLNIRADQLIESITIGDGGVVTVDELPVNAASVAAGDGAAFGDLAESAVAPVPEPGSATLLFGGMLTVLGLRRRRPSRL